MRAQVWSLDFIVAITIVILCSSIFITFIANGGQDTEAADLSTIAAKISEHLMSQGYPKNWTESDVKLLGITDGNWRINKTKAEQFYALPQAKLRYVLGTQTNIYVTIRNGSDIITDFGGDFVGKEPTNTHALANIRRYAIYRGSVVELQVVAWQ